jgi:hypothetical protein
LYSASVLVTFWTWFSSSQRMRAVLSEGPAILVLGQREG